MLPRNHLGFLITILFALLLSSIRVPGFVPEPFLFFNPDLALLVCFFWGSATTVRISVVAPWISGLFFDALYGYPLGLTGIILTLVYFTGSRLPYQQSKTFVWYQLGALVLLVTLSNVVILVLLSVFGVSQPMPLLVTLYSMMATVMVWFPLSFLLVRWLKKGHDDVIF